MLISNNTTNIWFELTVSKHKNSQETLVKSSLYLVRWHYLVSSLLHCLQKLLQSPIAEIETRTVTGVPSPLWWTPVTPQVASISLASLQLAS